MERAMNRFKSLRSFYVLLVVVALAPFTVFAQGKQAKPAPGKAPVVMAPAAPHVTSKEMPFSGPGWQDAILKQEGYVAPPKEIADAVLAKRYLNVSLSNLNPDKSWGLVQIGDGPVVMDTFSKP